MTLPHVYKPFLGDTFEALKTHVEHVRKCFDAPGAVYHDHNHPDADRFFRWFWHNLPVLVEMHHRPEFLDAASEIFGERVKPSYVFLSLYGPDGICPPHTDRPQCKYTIDLLVAQDGSPWPIQIHKTQDPDSERDTILLKPGEAVCYSGTGQRHYRDRMSETGPVVPSYANLAFFHFVPTTFVGKLE